LNPNKIIAVIPFYNESSTIKDIIERTLKFVDAVITVDDGSTDDSVSKIPASDKVYLVSILKNSGKGFALKKGFEKAIDLSAEKIITIDADLQHPPELIPSLIEKIIEYDIVIGNRMTDRSKMPLQRILSNRITSFILSWKTQQNIPDSQCGFRVYKDSVLKSISTNFNGYEAESEILIFAARKGFKIGNCFIPTIYNKSKSKINPFKTIPGFLRVIFI